jgi:hypothetical protein
VRLDVGNKRLGNAKIDRPFRERARSLIVYAKSISAQGKRPGLFQLSISTNLLAAATIAIVTSLSGAWY